MTTPAVDLPTEIADAMSAELRAATASLCHVAGESGIALYLVGGLLRDRMLLKTPPTDSATDLDLAVDGDPQALRAALRAERWLAHDRFGSVAAALADGSRIDLVRTRSERYPSPAALPIVEPAPIGADLARRDFTINAAAFGLTGPHRGLLLDPHGGRRDAQQRRLRTLHDGSFLDDPTRLLRLCRYAARIDGHVEPATARQARAATDGLAALSPARFGDAWRALLEDAAASQALRRARRLHLPQARLAGWEITPQAAAIVGAARFWAATGLTCANANLVQQLPNAAALHRQERAALTGGAALRAARRRIGHVRRLSDAATAAERVPTVALEVATELWSGAAAQRLEQIIAQRGAVRSPLDGRALAALGVPQGPAMGAWQRRLERALWDGELPHDEAARIAVAEQWVRSSPTTPT